MPTDWNADLLCQKDAPLRTMQDGKTIHWKQFSMKITFDGRDPLMEDNLSLKKNIDIDER